jgi:V/A-type H+-transporting ATPase subunit I
MISKLKKINIIAPKQYQEEILDILQSMGIAHVVKTRLRQGCGRQGKKLSSEIEDINYKLANIKFALNFLENNIPQKQSLVDKLSFERKSFSYGQIKKKVAKLNINKITSRIMEIEKNLEQGNVKLQELGAQLKELAPWAGLDQKPQATEYTATITGMINLNKYSEFMRELQAKVKELSIGTLYQGLKNVYLQITYLKELDRTVKTIIEKHKFQIKAPEAEEQPSAAIVKLKAERIRLKDTLKKWRRYIAKFKKYIKTLKAAQDFYTWELAKLETKQQIIKTKFFLSLRAWLKIEDLKTLKNALQEISPNILIIPVKRKKGENPPVMIENNNLIQPFETVTGIYGMPRYNEIDPTPFLAPFFIVFFALALTDAGYGLVMALGSFLAIKLLKIPREKQKLFRLLGYGGIVTFIIGALFGGWFGIDVTALSPGPVKGFIEFFKVIDPMRNTVAFMGLSFALGILQVWFARIVKIISTIKNNAPKETASAFAWAAFLLTGIIWLTGSFLHFSLLTKIALYIMILTIAGLIVTESLNTKNIFIKPLVGVIAIIQGLIGVLSDTLSYSRLMALGLATGIIAFIINTIAVIFRDLIPYAGWVVWVLILIGGHIFNLGINALGAFIHSGRLQFVEFFPKFMEGGGERFAPFKRESKYFNLIG